MRLIQGVYNKSPVVMQHAIVSAYGLYWNQLRFGGDFKKEYEGFRSREYFSATEWNEYTTNRLHELLVSAFQHVPYYRVLWSGIGLKASDLQQISLNDLATLPPTEKVIARDKPLDLLIGGVPQKNHKIQHTSGSTGTPVAVYWLPNEVQRSLAVREARACHFAGVSYRMPRATFSGRIVEPNPDSKGPFYRFNWFEKQVYFSAFHLRPETVSQYVKALWRHKTQWINGYSNSIYQLASMIINQGLDAPRLRAVITTSEKVTPEMREVIERAFSTKVYEEYGTVEDLFYVCECEHGRKHINPDAGIIEIVDEYFRPVKPGEIGEVLATGFIRPSQPTIRFRIGDLAVLDGESCPCGRKMPVLQEVVGRLEDTIYGLDGRRMVRFHGIFIDQPNVREGQIVQEELDLIRVRIVPQPGFNDADRTDVIGRIQQRLSSRMRVEIDLVDSIDRTKAGKFRAVICNLDSEEIKQITNP